MKWIDLSELANDMQRNPSRYTAWFLIAAPYVMKIIKRNNRKKSHSCNIFTYAL